MLNLQLGYIVLRSPWSFIEMHVEERWHVFYIANKTKTNDEDDGGGG